MTDDLTARTVHFPGANGDDVEGYLARPEVDERLVGDVAGAAASCGRCRRRTAGPAPSATRRRN